MHLIYADFMKTDLEDRLVLTTRGTADDLIRLNLKLETGLRLTFYNHDEDSEGNRDDLVVEGMVEHDDENDQWVAVIDWSAIKNLSALSPEDRHRLGVG